MVASPRDQHVDWFLERLSLLDSKAGNGGLTPAEEFERQGLLEMRGRWFPSERPAPSVKDDPELELSEEARKWVMLYWDVDGTGRLKPYLRLIPEFMDTEAAGSSHGFSIGGFQDSKRDAIEVAEIIASFMNSMMKQAAEDREGLDALLGG